MDKAFKKSSTLISFLLYRSFNVSIRFWMASVAFDFDKKRKENQYRLITASWNFRHFIWSTFSFRSKLLSTFFFRRFYIHSISQMIRKSNTMYFFLRVGEITKQPTCLCCGQNWKFPSQNWNFNFVQWIVSQNWNFNSAYTK